VLVCKLDGMALREPADELHRLPRVNIQLVRQITDVGTQLALYRIYVSTQFRAITCCVSLDWMMRARQVAPRIDKSPKCHLDVENFGTVAASEVGACP